MLGAGDVDDGGGAVGLDEEVVDVKLRAARVLGLDADGVEALALVERHMQELRGALLPAYPRRSSRVIHNPVTYDRGRARGSALWPMPEKHACGGGCGCARALPRDQHLGAA